ncbi:hypothetical protein [Halovivax sp.]|uniref:hypothetical protein n=1 Tax=Halovivax sp. TaxID=1935978 RepID=UPI0025C5577E|nr:hypothetical protein [Halovivax sp.]
MIRKLLLAFGVVEIVAPRQVIDACERIGLENPENAELRPWAVELARLEGLLFVWLLLRGRRRSPFASAALTLGGLVAVFVPRPLIRFSQAFAYENPTDLELKPWVEPAARLLGVVYLTVVVLSARADEDASTVGADGDAAPTRATTRT